MDWNNLASGIFTHWHIWLVSVVLVVAAVIDGWMLKVPNWITFPMIATGWIYSFRHRRFCRTWLVVLGSIVGLSLLFFLYAIGGMGAGDVKLLAGIGAGFMSSTRFTSSQQPPSLEPSWRSLWCCGAETG